MQSANSVSSHLLAAFGGDCLLARDLRDGAQDELFDYMDLCQGDTPLVDLVLECDSRPLLYMVRDDNLVNHHDKVNELCRRLASRGIAAYLGILEPGRLLIFPCLLENSQRFGATVEAAAPHASSLLVDLSQGVVHEDLVQAQKQLAQAQLSGKMLKALQDAGRRIHESPALTNRLPEDKVRLTLALVGRVLFTRFLLDRKLAPKSLVHDTDYTKWFYTPDAAAQLCTWLDETFNGELLPLIECQSLSSGKLTLLERYQVFFESLYERDRGVPQALYNLFLGSKHDKQYKLLTLLDFSHIPVGLLSEAYEDFAHHFDSATAEETSVHYTPRHIAETMVNQAFDGIPQEDRHRVCVLDPAVGAGVFLVAAFRRLAKERCRVGLPLDTASLRAVLYTQLRGLDINTHALSLASLALYLTAIELDPEPEPVTKLRFEQRLMGQTLFDVSASTMGLGSIGSSVPEHFAGAFDIVIGNPPWTSKRDDNALRMATSIVARRILHQRLADLNPTDVRTNAIKDVINEDEKTGIDYTPYFVPDLPFVWRAMEWAKPRGVIAFALHGRLLFKQTPTATKAREVLFRALRITGIVNGADLRQSDNIWPGITAPFCLLFARNEIPHQHEGLRFVTPYREGLSRQGRLRLDPSRSSVIDFLTIEAQPTIFKTLFRGTTLDVGIVDKIKYGEGAISISLKDYWKDTLRLEVGEGYIRAKEGRQDVTGKSPRKYEQKDASWLKMLNAKHIKKPIPWKHGRIDDEMLSDYDLDDDTMLWPRNENRYKPPLLLLWKSFSGKTDKDLGLYIGAHPVVFSERYLGFSASGHPDGELLLSYLFLLLQSVVARYFFLMTSSGYGVERESLNLDDIYSFPVIPLDKLSEGNKADIPRLLQLFWDTRGKDTSPIDSINAWACNLYGLSSYDRNSLKDSIGLFQDRFGAESAPDTVMLSDFESSVSADIDEVYALYGSTGDVEVEILPTPCSAWQFLEIRLRNLTPTRWADARLPLFANCADNEGASEIVITPESGRLLIGRLAQCRYWTASQARICGQSVIAHLVADPESWKLKVAREN